MALISVGDFQDWKSNIVTQGYFEAIHTRIEDAKEELSEVAGVDPDRDNFVRGFIAAYRELLDFRIDDMVEDQ